MEFEFDPSKSEAILAKHGIGFRRPQRLWEDSDLLEIAVKLEDEPRWMVVPGLKDDPGQR